ncbi:Sec1-like protein [Cynara cardunculus var. scolymus]|uniref:Sec1-like protein n=1 Tax=Cynara cardunculus var. scolymus TaxID=59895 RepID=A0A103XEC6_CYNCS|nr:Sec1-like protein [Cynara cardunculus var. scolymus]
MSFLFLRIELISLVPGQGSKLNPNEPTITEALFYYHLIMFISDMSGREPLYKKAFVFFSASIPKDFVGRIKGDTSVVPRVGALREMNLEYFPIDNQAFLTDHGGALEELYGEDAENSHDFNICLKSMATRIATVFASLKVWDRSGVNTRQQQTRQEMPLCNSHHDHLKLQTVSCGVGCSADRMDRGETVACCQWPRMPAVNSRASVGVGSSQELPVVRYRVKDVDGSTGTTFRDTIPSKVASAIWEYISSYKTTIPNYPQIETCELLIVDRSVDLVAPIIHEWTYDAMCHDLVDLDGNKYVMEVPSKSGGPPERKEFLLEDHDPVWLEMRYLHIAEASERLSDKMENLMSKNKAAQLQQKDSSELSTRDIQKMVQDLPAYNEQMEKLSLHVEIAGKINTVISEEGLRDLGQIEQDIVFGDAGHKELLEYLSENEDGNVENMLRLMMIYALADPEKFEGDNGAKLMELANLSHDDMRMIDNMRLLEGPVKKKKQETKGGFLNFDKKKANNALRKDKQGEEETWALFRFYPVLEELIEKIDKHELPKDEYKCINDPSTRGVSGHAAGRAAAQQSRRSRRTPAPGKASDDSDSVQKNAANDLKHMGQRIFVFIIGGATRSEKLKMLTMKEHGM